MAHQDESLLVFAESVTADHQDEAVRPDEMRLQQQDAFLEHLGEQGRFVFRGVRGIFEDRLEHRLASERRDRRQRLQAVEQKFPVAEQASYRAQRAALVRAAWLPARLRRRDARLQVQPGASGAGPEERCWASQAPQDALEQAVEAQQVQPGSQRQARLKLPAVAVRPRVSAAMEERHQAQQRAAELQPEEHRQLAVAGQPLARQASLEPAPQAWLSWLLLRPPLLLPRLPPWQQVPGSACEPAQHVPDRASSSASSFR
jgi:hypothetical protein